MNPVRSEDVVNEGDYGKEPQANRIHVDSLKKMNLMFGKENTSVEYAPSNCILKEDVGKYPTLARHLRNAQNTPYMRLVENNTKSAKTKRSPSCLSYCNTESSPCVTSISPHTSRPAYDTIDISSDEDSDEDHNDIEEVVTVLPVPAISEAEQHTALKSAVLDGHGEILQILLENNMDNINKKNKFGKTALHSAVGMGYHDIVKILIETGADINIPDYFGNTPLHEAILNEDNDVLHTTVGHYEIVKTLLDESVDLNESNKYGETALHVAVTKANFRIAKLLLEHGIDVDIRDKNGNTALHVAVINANFRIAKLLIDHDINVNTRDNIGNTALRVAVKVGDCKIIQLLLDQINEYTALYPSSEARKENMGNDIAQKRRKTHDFHVDVANVKEISKSDVEYVYRVQDENKVSSSPIHRPITTLDDSVCNELSPVPKPWEEREHNAMFVVAFTNGWTREVVTSINTTVKGKPRVDVYYHAPTGELIRSINELNKYLAVNASAGLSSENFTWRRTCIYKEPEETSRMAGTSTGRKRKSDVMTTNLIHSILAD